MRPTQEEPNLYEQSVEKNLEPNPSTQETTPNFETENKEKNPQELIDFRFHQSYGSQLSEHLTGLRPDNPRIVDRLYADQETVRMKYGLPSRDMRFDSPAEYEDFLRDAAKKLKVDIREKSDCGSFFEDNPGTGGVHFDDGRIGASMDKKDLESYTGSLATLEHELIHASQKDKYPGMPIEK